MALKSILGSLLFDDSPDLPALDSIDLGAEQLKSLTGNLAALPQATDLASRVNQFNQAELLKGLRGVIPDLDKKLALASEGLDRGLAGELPIGDRNRIWDAGVAGSLSSGTGGLESGQGRNRVQRDLGIAEQDTFFKSLGAFESWVQAGRTYLTAPQMDITSAFVSPMQQAGFDVAERGTQWNYDWFKNQAAAQPAPWEKAVQGLLDWTVNTGAAAGTMMLGKGLGNLWGGGGANPDANAPGSARSGGGGIYGGGSAWG